MKNVRPTQFPRFQYNTDLYEKVSLALNRAEKIKIIPQTKKNAEGALAQVCWTHVEPVVQHTSRRGHHCTGGFINEKRMCI